MNGVIVTLEFDGDDKEVQALITAAKEFSGGGKEFFSGDDDFRDAVHLAVEETLYPTRRRASAPMRTALLAISTGQTTWLSTFSGYVEVAPDEPLVGALKQ